MKKTFIIVLCFMALISCSRQAGESAKKIEFDTGYWTLRRGFVLARPFNAWEFKNQPEKLPDLSNSSDTSYARTSVKGISGVRDGDVVILISNVSSATPRLLIDRNNNFDFSDDGKPLTFSSDSNEITLQRDRDGSSYTERWYQIPDSIRKETDRIVEQHLAGSKPVANYFFSQSLNMKAGNAVIDGDSIRIGLYDINKNGIYNDIGSDRITIGQHGHLLMNTDRYEGAQVIDSTNYFQGQKWAYRMVGIDSTGNSITIEKAIQENLENVISIGDTIPNYKFETFDGDSINLYSLQAGQNYLYLSFWAGWCVGCVEEVDELHTIHEKFGGQVTLVGLNYNEDRERAEQFLESHNVTWKIGESTGRINNELNIYGLPRGVLVDRNGKIISMNIHPKALIEKLETGKL